MTKEQVEAIWGDRVPLVKLLRCGDDLVWVDRGSGAERTYKAAGWANEPMDEVADELAATAVAEVDEAEPAPAQVEKRGPGRPRKNR